MIELTTHQFNVLTSIANNKKNKPKVFATFTSTEADGQASALIDRLFAESMALVEMGLLFDVTSYPKHQEVVEGYMKNEGRALRVLAPSAVVKHMFKHVAWESWIN
jgi:hypothetical protein